MSESGGDPLNPESWYAEPNVCGSCIAWRPEPARPGETVASGSCRLRPELPRVPATLKLCSLYKGRGVFVYTPGKEPAQRKKRASAVTVMRRGPDDTLVELKVPARSPRPEPNDDDTGGRVGPRRSTPLARPYEVPRSIDIGTDSPPMLRQILQDVLRAEHGSSGRELTPRYKGGKIEVKSTDGRVVHMTTERFFVMLDLLRARLDELEDAFARTDAMLEHMPEVQKQIAAIQGSFTTFNFLFSDRSDYFGG